jgi:hypothetical protein
VKKVLGMVTAGVTLAAGLYLLLVATAPPKTTHHAQIQVKLLDAEGTPERKVAEYERVVQVLDAAISQFGFARVLPEQAGSTRSSMSTTGERATYFRETQPQDPTGPMEVIVTFNPDLAPVVQVSMAEGYHRRPSARLQKLHFVLQEQLRQRYGGQIISAKIW